jgi:hypothetical protein
MKARGPLMAVIWGLGLFAGLPVVAAQTAATRAVVG